jgi:hypothetical protein
MAGPWWPSLHPLGLVGLGSLAIFSLVKISSRRTNVVPVVNIVAQQQQPEAAAMELAPLLLEGAGMQHAPEFEQEEVHRPQPQLVDLLEVADAEIPGARGVERVETGQGQALAQESVLAWVEQLAMNTSPGSNEERLHSLYVSLKMLQQLCGEWGWVDYLCLHTCLLGRFNSTPPSIHSHRWL